MQVDLERSAATRALSPRPAAVPPLIRLAGVSKDYRRGKVTVPVLDRVDLTLAEGAFVAVMGSSGCGKTTLLNLIGGLDAPSSGQVSVGGVGLGRLTSRQLAAWRASTVGFIFQFYNLLPGLTAAANVELPLLLHSMSAAERCRRVHDVLDIVGLTDRAGHRPAELSGGQQQRVAIARAIVADPGILLCDEPTGDLDRAAGLRIMETLQMLNEDFGKTIVVATHDREVAGFAGQSVQMGDLGAAARRAA